jgi:hypothetical protein
MRGQGKYRYEPRRKVWGRANKSRKDMRGRGSIGLYQGGMCGAGPTRCVQKGYEGAGEV